MVADAPGGATIPAVVGAITPSDSTTTVFLTASSSTVAAVVDHPIGDASLKPARLSIEEDLASAGKTPDAAADKDEDDDSANDEAAAAPASSTPAKSRARIFLERAWALIKKHWFLEGLACVIVLAYLWPALGKKQGLIRADITVSYVAVALIFLLSGVSLRTRVLMRAFADWKQHLVTQAISLGATPAIGLAVGRLLGLSSLNPTLVKGLIIATSTPTTISSNVLMTKQAMGDEAGALTNAVIGNILGVFVSPSLIFTYAGNLAGGNSLNYGSTFSNLAITVVAPLIAGQLLQFFFPNAVAYVSARLPLGIINSSLLLALVWNVFCDTFSENIGASVDAVSIVCIVLIDLSLFCLFSALCFFVSRIPLFRFSRAATIAIMMCGATKTVALGIPMINIIYAGSPLIGIISTPLLIYHAGQLVLGAILVGILRSWLERGNLADAERARLAGGTGDSEGEGDTEAGGLADVDVVVVGGDDRSGKDVEAAADAAAATAATAAADIPAGVDPTSVQRL